MGNTASRTGPGVDLADLPDVVFKDSLGNGRFFKTSLCLHDEGGLVVVKSYRPPEGSFPNFGDLEQYEDQIVALRTGLATISTTITGQACPHVWPTQRVYHSDRGVHLVRQYFYSNLAARITSRPFLTTIERLWLAWQLLIGLEQAHQAGICHGDVKAENVLLTSWGWLFIADFAPYKPIALPADNPVRVFQTMLFGGMSVSITSQSLNHILNTLT